MTIAQLKQQVQNLEWQFGEDSDLEHFCIIIPYPEMVNRCKEYTLYPITNEVVSGIERAIEDGDIIEDNKYIVRDYAYDVHAHEQYKKGLVK